MSKAEIQRNYYWRNRDRVRARKQTYSRANRAKLAAYARTYRAQPIAGLANRLRARIAQALRNKSLSTERLIGCSFAKFRQHIEAQFVKGMSWSNRHLWHVDHIKPVSKFDLSTLVGQRAAFHYTNCQPLWAPLNFAKGARC